MVTKDFYRETSIWISSAFPSLSVKILQIKINKFFLKRKISLIISIKWIWRLNYFQIDNWRCNIEKKMSSSIFVFFNEMESKIILKHLSLPEH